jgi:bla regulator protein blaR1
MTALPAHLIESTLFCGLVWLITLSLRRNHARTRHTIWMAASAKFLIPFSLFVGLGSHIVQRPAASVPPPQMRFVMVDSSLTAPGAAPSQAPPSAAIPRDWRTSMLWLVWLCGCAGLLVRWCVRWRSASVHLRTSTPWNPSAGFSSMPVPIRSSPSVFEPSVFGLFRPVLVLPAAIEDRLSGGELQAVLAHELCHVRHRDNLAAALHMVVEALFWFHPLVWWISARLVDERERACDEEVLRLGHSPAVYAESILGVCRFCLESRVPCVSGISGADLKQRIRTILSAPVLENLHLRKKLMLAAMGATVVAVPILIGLTRPARLVAQAVPQTAVPMQFEVASVKLDARQDIFNTRPKRSVGRFRWTTQLIYLVSYAYNLQWWRITGDTTGFGSIYEVDATTDPKATEDQVRLMVQSLLMDRFKMVAHRETKVVDGYILGVARGGPKMQEAKDSSMPALPEWERRGPPTDPAILEGLVVSHLPERGVGATMGRRVTMLQLTDTLQATLDTAVVDQTGLSGKYYFAYRYATGDDPDVPYPNLFAAIGELGLKLEKHKGPAEILVVDHIEKEPAAN